MLGTKLGTSGHNHEHNNEHNHEQRTKSAVEVGAPPKNWKKLEIWSKFGNLKNNWKFGKN